MTMQWWRPPASGYRRFTGDEPPPAQSGIRIEALGNAYQLQQQGIRSEGEEAVRGFNYGEIVSGQTGDFISRMATVVTPYETYTTTVTEYVVSGDDELRVRVEDDDPGLHFADDPVSETPVYEEPSAEIPYTDISSDNPYNAPIDDPITYYDPLPAETAPVEGDVYTPPPPADEPAYEEPSAYDPNTGEVAPPGWTPEETDYWS